MHTCKGRQVLRMVWNTMISLQRPKPIPPCTALLPAPQPSLSLHVLPAHNLLATCPKALQASLLQGAAEDGLAAVKLTALAKSETC